jgi:2-isopropylmalate synthase
MKQILILDSTLREGEQSRGVCFSLAEKISIATMLRDFGVDLIEIGQPGISAIETEVCKSICESVPKVDFLVHARANRDDVLAARKTTARWIGIWASYNDISLATKFNNKSRSWIKTQVASAIGLAKDLGFKVRFTIEDASRTELNLIDELASAAIIAGADRISLADTVGIWHPNKCAEMVKFAVEKFGCQIEVHLHNDLGLAQANAIAAIEAGASVIDTSVLGIGERAGICDLISLTAALQQFYASTKYNFQLAKDLAQAIARIACCNIEPHHPIIGRNSFTHVAKYHAKAANTNPQSYEALDPSCYGRERSFAVNPLERKPQHRLDTGLRIKQPFIKGASELLHHRDGVGNRWVFMDNRVDARSHVYIIERIFEKDYTSQYQPHVDSHAHHCDSVFVFMGNNYDGTGLTVSVTFGEGKQQTTQTFTSPASVYIPANIYHSYAYIAGTGRFLNFVLSPNYNESIVNQ